MLQISSERIQHYILSQLPPEQSSFVPGRGPREHILNLNHIIEKAREFYICTYLCFIYYTKAVDWLAEPFHVSKGPTLGYILSPLLFNMYREWIMRKSLENWNGGIMFNGRKISNLRYVDDTTLIARIWALSENWKQKQRSLFAD